MKSKPFTSVYAITPNPALDLSGTSDEIIANEKNYVSHEKRLAGGNSINAARVLSHLSQRVRAGGFLGGAIGQQVKDLLKSERISCDFVEIENETRINITVSNRATHKQTRLSFPGPEIRLAEKQALARKLSLRKEGCVFLLGGSFPKNFGVPDAKRIIQQAHQKGIVTILDVPYKELRGLLKSRPLMIKPNLHEFEQLVGKKRMSRLQIIAEAKKILPYCPVLCISSVDKGALLVTRNDSYFAKGPRVTAKSSVGAGDSMVGAMTAAMIDARLSYDMFFSKRNGDTDRALSSVWPEVLKLGLGAALATITLPGTGLGKQPEIDKFSKKVRVTRL